MADLLIVFIKHDIKLAKTLVFDCDPTADIELNTESGTNQGSSKMVISDTIRTQ